MRILHHVETENWGEAYVFFENDRIVCAVIQAASLDAGWRYCGEDEWSITGIDKFLELDGDEEDGNEGYYEIDVSSVSKDILAHLPPTLIAKVKLGADNA